MVIKGKLYELFELVRECEYNRLLESCRSCLFYREDCEGIDTVCELEVEDDGTIQSDIHQVLE